MKGSQAAIEAGGELIRKHYYRGPLRALSLKGYEIGSSATQHGIVRVEVSFNGESAWVEIGQQARDLAAGKITLAQVRASSTRAGGARL